MRMYGRNFPLNVIEKVDPNWMVKIGSKPSTIHGSNLSSQEMRCMRESGVIQKAGTNSKKQTLWVPGSAYQKVIKSIKTYISHQDL